jgi:hypothetical protein
MPRNAIMALLSAHLTPERTFVLVLCIFQFPTRHAFFSSDDSKDEYYLIFRLDIGMIHFSIGYFKYSIIVKIEWRKIFGNLSHNLFKIYPPNPFVCSESLICLICRAI